MIPIRQHGRLLQTDPDGFLIGEARLDHIIPPWTEAVDYAREAFLRHLGDAVHSIYIRGSVPRGLAIEGVSDIDTYFVVHGGPDACQALDLSWTADVRADFRRRFSFCPGMERLCIPLGKVIGADADFWPRFMIKVNSACLHGEDLAQHIPPISIADVLRERPVVLPEKIEYYYGKIAGEEDPHQLREWCRWLMKWFPREGIRLVAEREQAYTRDLYPAYACFAKYYPERATQMRQALEWAVNPIADPGALTPFIETFGGWLAEELATHQPPSRR